MYVNPFVMGVFVTIMAEVIFIVLYGFFHRKK